MTNKTEMMFLTTDTIEQITLPEQFLERGSIVTIGAFDGIHRGHQHLIREMIQDARQKNVAAGLITFYPHPAVVLANKQGPLYLTTPGEKNILLEALGLDWVAVLAFNQHVAALSPQIFLQHLERFGVQGLYVSDDFAFGHKRTGTIKQLNRLGKDMGLEIRVIPALWDGSTRISSSLIRKFIRRGQIRTANDLLGRPYSLSGEVIHGAKRGRCIGYPTANLDVHPNRMIPANGIYATFAYLGTERHLSVTNIGTRPSFDNGERSIEAYLLDFGQNIYGCDLVLEFIDRLRPETRFADVQALIDKIGQDVVQARSVLNDVLDSSAEKTTQQSL